jgi:hypothetical protein
LELVEKCKNECSEDYLEKNGSSQRLQKNVFWLKNSKAKKCSSAKLPQNKEQAE